MESSQQRINDNVVSLKYGIEPRGTYMHASKHCNIIALTFNSKTNQYIILDSRGISSWFKNSAFNYCTRLLNFDSYKFNLLRDIIYCRSANIYFGVSKDYGIKVYNLSFIEIFCIERDGTTIMKLVFDAKRSELIIISRNNFQFWKYTIVEQSRACEGLKLQREYSVPDSSLISNAEYDDDSQRLYLVCDHDIWCYDVLGHCIAHFVHSRYLLSSLSVCTFSKQANTLIAGSSMGEISIYDTTGGLFTTLLNHTQVITSLLAHPNDGNLFISASMDGTIKIFSLQTFEEIYSLNVFSDGIHWMKLRANHTIYCSSQKSVRLFDLNYICSFWSTVRCPVQSINIFPKQENKSSHIVVHGEDKCIRIYNKRSGRKRCTILPPPENFMMKDVLSFSYDRIGNVIYILYSEMQLWIYITRTDPATRVAVWNIQDILKNNMSNLTYFEGSGDMNNLNGFGVGSFSQKKEKAKVKCLCTGTVSRNLYADRLETSTSLNFNLLMCGMSNGTVYFVDPCAPVSIILGFKAHPTSPILELKTIYGTHETHILTLIQTIDCLCVKIWNASNFKELDTIVVSKDISVYFVKSSIFVSGNYCGNLQVVRLKHVGENISPDDANIKDESKEHNGRIVSVDILERREFICSCGEDQYIRLWNFQKYLLTEIKLDETLCYSSFLGSKGSLLIGFKSHLFTISCDILNLPNVQVSDDSSDGSDNESVVYEDPDIRQEFRRHTELKPESLANYLIPYPYLNLDSRWMYQKPISDENIDKRSSRPSSNNSDVYAATETYADSLCSSLSNIYLDVGMPKCCESPELKDPVENVDRPLCEVSNLNQNQYEYDLIRSHVELPSTSNLDNSDKFVDSENVKNNMVNVIDNDIAQTLRNDQQGVEEPASVKKKQSVKKTQSVKKQKKAKKKRKLKYNSSKLSIKESINIKSKNTPSDKAEVDANFQETKHFANTMPSKYNAAIPHKPLDIDETPSVVIGDKSETEYASPMDEKKVRGVASADEYALKNIPVSPTDVLSSSLEIKSQLDESVYDSPFSSSKSIRTSHDVIAQFAVNYFQSSTRSLSASTSRNIFKAMPLESEGILKRSSSAQYNNESVIGGSMNPIGNIVDGGKSFEEKIRDDHLNVASQSVQEKILNISNDEIHVVTSDDEDYEEIVIYLCDEENEGCSETNVELQPRFKEYRDLNDIRKPSSVSRVSVADRYPVKKGYILLNNNFNKQTDSLPRFHSERNLQLESWPANRANVRPNLYRNYDRSRFKIMSLNAKVKRLSKRFHSKFAFIHNNHKDDAITRVAQSNDIALGICSTTSADDQAEGNASLRGAKNVLYIKNKDDAHLKSIKDNAYLKRDLFAINLNRKHTTRSSKTVSVNQMNADIGFDFVFQGNVCPIAPKHYCKSSPREDQIRSKKVDINIDSIMKHRKSRRTSSVLKSLSTVQQNSETAVLRSGDTKGIEEVNIYKAKILLSKSDERCFGEEGKNKEYINSHVYPDWSTTPPHVSSLGQNNDVNTCIYDNAHLCANSKCPQHHLTDDNPEKHENKCMKVDNKENHLPFDESKQAKLIEYKRKSYKCESSRSLGGYGTQSSMTDRSLYSYNDKISRLNSGKSYQFRRRLSINSSPLYSEKSSPSHLPDKTSIGTNSDIYCYNEPTNITTSLSKHKSTLEEKRKEMLMKLEHKMSAQPYRLHREKTQGEIANDQVKLMFLQSKDLGQQFLPRSKRSISIPGKCEYRTIVYESSNRK